MNGGVRGGNRLAVVFSLGFFALAAQSLLFREFFSVFEGNELGMGVFFSSWLLWAGAGALAARAGGRRPRLTAVFEWLPLLYIPAYLAQWHLVRHARALAGVEPYELFPLAKMLPAAMAANAPVSFVTGLLFTLACAWLADAGGLPPARVYFFEALGGAAGGVAVTAALAAGWSSETVFLAAALLPAAAPLAGRRRAGWLPVLLLAAALGLRADRAWRQRSDRAMWSRMLPADSFRGRFVTPQATYLCGEYAGQFVVRAWESVVESIPDEEHAGEIAALGLAQAPAARRILVVGGGYSLCERFLQLEQVESVTWLHPDPDYPTRLLGVLPQEYHGRDARLRMPAADPRRFLEGDEARYDLAVLNLPDTTTLSLNRYGTREFYRRLRDRLDPAAGVAAIRFSGGENYLGGELVNLGASVLATVESVFPTNALQPGGESWLFASVGAELVDSPAAARDRLASIPGVGKVCLPERLLSAFPADRIEFQRAAYRQAAERAPPGWLLNTDARPRALLFALLVAGLQGGLARDTAAAVRALSVMGPWLLLLPWLLYGALRFAYRLRGRPVAASSAFDAGFLVFSAGLAGMSFSLVLLFLYQSAFGSIYLQLGLLSALFMLGLFAGGWTVERVLVRLAREPAGLLPLAVALHAGLIACAGSVAGRLAFSALFFLAGFFGGLYVPLAVFRLKRAGRGDATAGAAVEWLDTLGGSAGGLLLGLLILPLYGLAAALSATALALAANVPAHFLKVRGPAPGDAADRWARRLGYLLAGAAAFALFVSWTWERTRRVEPGVLLREAAGILAPGQPLLVKEARLADGRTVSYLEAEGGGFLFTTDQLAPQVSGYGGPITMGVLVDAKGALRAARILRARETPRYQKATEAWLGSLRGRNLFDMTSLRDVDGVSGATLTSTAVLETLRAAGCLFSQQVLKMSPSEAERSLRRFPFDKQAAVFLGLAVTALVLRRRPRPWFRRLFLLLVAVWLGWRWNMQYSAAHVLAAIAGAWPAAGVTLPFLLAAGVPALVAAFGNIYCGWLCPFGALQELAGELGPRAWKFDPEKPAWRYARWLKYGLLFILVLGYALRRDLGLADWDPLNAVFSPLRSPAVLALGVTVLVLSVAYRRFWCRHLCPAGAFLALLNGLKLTFRWWPPVRPGCCDYGVRHVRELDCILCDRCRMRTLSRTHSFPELRAAMLFAVLAGFLLYFVPRLRPRAEEPEAAAPVAAPSVATHRARDVDMPRLRALLDRGLLSTNEALYYRRIGAGTSE